MTKKQLVDNYLSKNANKVETWRNQKGFSWKEVVEDLGDKSVDGNTLEADINLLEDLLHLLLPLKENIRLMKVKKINLEELKNLHLLPIISLQNRK